MNPPLDHSRLPAALLAAVSSDLRPVRPSPKPSWRAIGILPLALAAVIGVFCFIGLRRDTAVMGPVLAWGASFLQLLLAIALVWIAARENTPGQRLPKTFVRGALAAAALIVAGVSLWTFHARPIVIPARFSAWRAAYSCGLNSTYAGVILVVLVALILGRRLLAERPALVGALFGAAAGVVVNAGWRLSCPVSSPSHALGAHAGPILITTLVGAAVVSLMAKLTWGRRS